MCARARPIRSRIRIIQPNYLSDPMDRRVLLGGMRLARRLLHTPELAHYFDGDVLPGPDAQSDDELLDLRAHTAPPRII